LVLWEGKVRMWGRNETTEGGWDGLHTYIRGGVCYVSLGNVGPMEGLWLGKRGGGEGPGGVFLEKD
jgi:hypothetical protein